MVTASTYKRSGEGGNSPAHSPHLIAKSQFSTYPQIWQCDANLWLLGVFYGCLGLFGIVLSTLLAHPTSSPARLIAAQTPSTRDGSSGRRRNNSDSAGDGGDVAGDDPDGLSASYSRFSSDLQSRDSITDQQRVCREHAERLGFRIPHEYEFADEAVSGTKLHRAGLDALLAAAAQGRFRVLFFHNLSRLARESVISMPLIKQLVHVHRVRVISCTEGLDTANQGWNLIATMSSLQHERYIEDLSANVFRGQEGNVLAGLSVGDYCFGYTSEPGGGIVAFRRGKHAKPPMVYKIDPEQAAVVRQVFAWFVNERRSLRWINKELNRLGAAKDHRASSRKWFHQCVVKLLSNRKYIGIWAWGLRRNVRNPLTGQIQQERRSASETDKWVRHLPDLQIIDPVTFEKAQELLQKNRERLARRREPNGRLRGSVAGSGGEHPRHLLSGLIRCSACGAIFYVSGAAGKYMSCSNSMTGLCECRTQLRRDRAERLILDAIRDRVVDNPGWRRAILDAAMAAWRELATRVPDELAAERKAVADFDTIIRRLVDSIERGDAPPEVNKRLEARTAERDVRLRRLAQLERTSQVHTDPPTAEWLELQLQHLAALLRGDAPAAALALRSLVGEIQMTEIRRDNRRRFYLRGCFRICQRRLLESILPAIPTSDQFEVPSAQIANAPFDEIFIDFIEPNPTLAQASEAVDLHQEGLLCCEIAEEIGVSRSRLSKLLAIGFRLRGLPKPDGRSRRTSLNRKHTALPQYQAIADTVKELLDQNLLLGEIAEHMGCDRNTITTAIRYWYKSRGLAVPDGRTRRKALPRPTKESSPSLPTDPSRDPKPGNCPPPSFVCSEEQPPSVHFAP